MASATDLVSLYEGFRLYCLAEGKQQTTIRWYMGKLRVFFRYLQKSGLSTDASELTTANIRGFLVHLRENVRTDENNPSKPTQETNLSAQTIQGYARTVKAFFSWATREDLLRENPAKRVRIPKAPRVLIATLNEEHIRRLLAAIDSKCAIGFRD